jgi:NAD(P)H-dependent flavin oxidoreductase YrpB (nitropropane dioxygenase family)
MTLDELDEDQKAAVMDLVITTVKEIREQIALDILATIPLWESRGWAKSRRTKKAFEAGAAIARGQNEVYGN